MIVVRYADDRVGGFQYRREAERFLREFRERLAKFGLELHADKTRLIESGRFAAENRKRRGVFQCRLRRLWRNILFRRSQKGRKSWKRLSRLLDRWIPIPRVLHPYPMVRFCAIHAIHPR